MWPVGENVFEHGVHLCLDAWQCCSLQLIKGSDIMMTSTVGEIMKVLDKHSDNLESVRHRDGQVTAAQTCSRAAWSGRELGEPHSGKN